MGEILLQPRALQKWAGQALFCSMEEMRTVIGYFFIGRQMYNQSGLFNSREDYLSGTYVVRIVFVSLFV